MKLTRFRGHFPICITLKRPGFIDVGLRHRLRIRNVSTSLRPEVTRLLGVRVG